MPRQPLRPCAKPGCPELVRPPERYCERHRWTEGERKRERHRVYDEQLRDERATSFYRSRAWKAVRLQVLVRDNYLCQECLRENRITRATTVHHIVPLAEDWERRLDPDNLESVCSSCHNRIEGKQEGVIG